MTAIRANGLAIFALVLESRAEETTLPPNQTAPPDRSEIVEGQVKGGRDQRQIVGANSCAAFRQVGNIAAACPRLPLEEEQRTFCDARSTDGSAIELGLPLIEIADIRHQMRS
jgi:hypothetical protein